MQCRRATQSLSLKKPGRHRARIKKNVDGAYYAVDWGRSRPYARLTVKTRVCVYACVPRLYCSGGGHPAVSPVPRRSNGDRLFDGHAEGRRCEASPAEAITRPALPVGSVLHDCRRRGEQTRSTVPFNCNNSYDRLFWARYAPPQKNKLLGFRDSFDFFKLCFVILPEVMITRVNCVVWGSRGLVWLTVIQVWLKIRESKVKPFDTKRKINFSSKAVVPRGALIIA